MFFACCGCRGVVVAVLVVVVVVVAAVVICCCRCSCFLCMFGCGLLWFGWHQSLCVFFLSGFPGVEGCMLDGFALHPPGLLVS